MEQPATRGEDFVRRQNQVIPDLRETSIENFCPLHEQLENDIESKVKKYMVTVLTVLRDTCLTRQIHCFNLYFNTDSGLKSCCKAWRLSLDMSTQVKDQTLPWMADKSLNSILTLFCPSRFSHFSERHYVHLKLRGSTNLICLWAYS